MVFQELPGVATAHFDDIFRCSLSNEFTTSVTTLGAKVNDPI